MQPSEHRVNHRAAERDLCAKVRGGFDLSPDDVLYLIERVESLRRQVDDERDAAAMVNA